MQKETPRLVTGSVGRHLAAQTAPMLFGIVAIMLVGIADAYFIGRLGPDPLAAISFIFPVQTALQSIGVGIMVGINSVVSRALGAGEGDRARCRAAQGMLFALLIGLAVALAVHLLTGPLFRLMNATDATLPLIRAYMTPYLVGLPILLLAMSANGILRAQGEAVRSSLILVVVSLFNGGLDPLLIHGWGPVPALGIAGAAWAFVIASVIGAALGFGMVRAARLVVRVADVWRASLVRAAAEIGGVGLPAAVSSSINPAGLAFLTGVLARHGEDTVAAFGAAGRVQTLAVVPFLALSAGIGGVVGQNVGAAAWERAQRALRLASIFCLGWGAAITVPLVLFGPEIGSVFTDDPQISREVGRYFLIAAWGYAGYGLLVVATGVMNAEDRAVLAFGVSVARVLLVMVPVAWIGSGVLGPDGVYGAELLANLLGGGLAWWLARESLR